HARKEKHEKYTKIDENTRGREEQVNRKEYKVTMAKEQNRKVRSTGVKKDRIRKAEPAKNGMGPRGERLPRKALIV
ncbi:hypothetical protein LTS18_005560, partial [Coniosporium uncinatum]